MNWNYVRSREDTVHKLVDAFVKTLGYTDCVELSKTCTTDLAKQAVGS